MKYNYALFLVSESDSEPLFGEDLSDEDPTYQPNKSPRNPFHITAEEDDSPTEEDSFGSNKINQANATYNNQDNPFHITEEEDLVTEENSLVPNDINQANNATHNNQNNPPHITDEEEDLARVEDSFESNDINQADATHIKQNNQPENSYDIASSIVSNIFDLVWKRVKPLSRWRNANPSSWKRNVVKKRCAEGLPYETKNRIRPPKVPKLIDCSSCQYKCTEAFNEQNRERICRLYWSLDFPSKKNFILNHVKIAPPKRVVVARKRATQRSYTKKCYFDLGLEEKQVCQKFFCSVLSISPSVIKDAVEKRDNLGFYSLNGDPRGHHEPPNKTPLEKIEEVIAHIESFPTMESHYVRQKTRRKYLDYKLSITKMYELYREKYKDSQPVSEITYRRIFSKEFNLGFFVPKKDQCLLCTKYARANVKEKMELEISYLEHIERKNKCNAEKQRDKERAETEKTFMTATFDLQAILQIPSAEIGLLYYSRKLVLYNLALYENVLPNDAYCFTWSEIHGKKGSSEIGSILYYYLSEYISHDITEVSLFSDTCGGQNRNQFVAAVLLWTVNKIDHLQKIEQKFLESGHSYMEADSMHSSIESAKKNESVYSVTDWINIFKRARSKQVYKVGQKNLKKKPYHVREFKFHEFKDLKKLAETIYKNKTKDNEGKPVKWLKIKRMVYVKGETKIYFNYDMSETLLYFDIRSDPSSVKKAALGEVRYNTRKTKKSVKEVSVPEEEFTFPSQLEQLYLHPLPISAAKKKDLLKLCTTGVIPEEYHGWYQSLTCEEFIDRLPDLAASEGSSDDD